MKVAIVGTCPSSRMQSQSLPPDWQVWACAPDNVEVLSRIDAWFELHGDLDYEWHQDMFGPYLAWLNLQDFPIYAQHTRLIPRAKIFPYERLIERFGGYWFTSQPAWMFAYAIDQGAEEIGLYGLDMAARSEYHQQRPAIHRFVEIAEARGIKVHAPPSCEVLQAPPLYCYSLNGTMARKLKIREMEVRNRIAEFEKTLEDTRLKLQHFYGVLDDVDYVQQTWTGQPVPMSPEESDIQSAKKVHKFPRSVVIKGED